MVFEQVWTDLPPRPVDAQFIVDFNAGLADIWCENEADDDSWAREKAYRDAVRGAGDPSERAVYLLEREAMGQVADASSRLLAADGIVQHPLVFERVLPVPNGVVMWDYPGEYIGFSWHVKDEERIVMHFFPNSAGDSALISLLLPRRTEDIIEKRFGSQLRLTGDSHAASGPLRAAAFVLLASLKTTGLAEVARKSVKPPAPEVPDEYMFERRELSNGWMNGFGTVTVKSVSSISASDDLQVVSDPVQVLSEHISAATGTPVDAVSGFVRVGIYDGDEIRKFAEAGIAPEYALELAGD